jgi:predicted kinase
MEIVDRSTRGPVAYRLLEMLASRQLAFHKSAILDGMFGSGAVRDRLRQLATSEGAAWAPIECTLADEDLHRARVAERDDAIPGWPNPDCVHLEQMRHRYQPWRGRRLQVDAAMPFELNLRRVRDYVSAGCPDS